MMLMIPTTTLEPVWPGDKPSQNGLTPDAVDFFAAFFAPALAPPVTSPAVEAVKPDTGGEMSAFDDAGSFTSLVQTGVQGATGPAALAPKVNAAAEVDAKAKPAEPEAKPDPATVPHPIKPFELAIDPSIHPKNTGEHDRMKPVPSVCALPSDIAVVEREPRDRGVTVTLDPGGEYMPVDVLTLDRHDHPIELELGPAQPPRTETVQAEAVLEIGAHLPMQPRSIFEEKRADLLQDRVRTPVGSETPTSGESSQTPLLDTFTTNVMHAAGTKDAAAIKVPPVEETIEFAPEAERQVSERTEFPDDVAVDAPAAAAHEFRTAPGEISLPESRIRRVVLDQVSSRLSEMVIDQGAGEDKRSIKIRLNPADLGTVEITLVRNAEGVLDAHIHTDNPATHNALKETLAQLRDSLENSGNKVGTLDTSCSNSSGHTPGRRDSERPADTQIYRTTFPDAVEADPASSRSREQNRLVSLTA